MVRYGTFVGINKCEVFLFELTNYYPNICIATLFLTKPHT